MRNISIIPTRDRKSSVLIWTVAPDEQSICAQFGHSLLEIKLEAPEITYRLTVWRSGEPTSHDDWWHEDCIMLMWKAEQIKEMFRDIG